MPSYTLEPPWLSGPVAPRFVITARDAYDNQVKVNIATEYADTEYRFVMEMFGCKSVPGVSASCPDEMCEDEPLATVVSAHNAIAGALTDNGLPLCTNGAELSTVRAARRFQPTHPTETSDNRHQTDN